MFINATGYNPDTGEIKGHYGGEEGTIKLNAPHYVIGDYDRARYYIDRPGDNPTPRKRPVMPVNQNKTTVTADGRDTMVLSGLPAPCEVEVGEETYQVPDGELEWSTLLPTTYKIRIKAFPYLDWEGEVNAVASNPQTD